jgi:hypothetical protein
VSEDDTEAQLRKLADAGDIAEFIELRLFQEARNGNYQPLGEYLESGKPITPALRRYFVELLPHDPKHPKGRHRLKSTVDRYLEIAEFVEHKRREGARDHIKQTMQHFKIKSRRTIGKAKALRKVVLNAFEESSTAARLAKSRRKRPLG